MNENTKSYADLAEEVNKKFSEELLNSEKIKNKLKKLMDKDANFKDVYEVSDEVSDKMKTAFKEKISKDILPDGKMQKDIADSVIKANLKEGHEIISGYAADTQGLINKKQGINIKGIQAEFNEERCDNLINKLCKYDDYDKGKWLLVEPIKNFCNSAVDDTIEANADFLSKSGFKETISRSTNGGCCEWCEEVSGTFDYEYVKEWVLSSPKHNVFSRHRYCNCIISHTTEKGRKAVNNQWNEEKHKKKRLKLNEEPKTLKKDDVKTKNFTSGSGKNYPIRLNGSEHVKFADEYIKNVTVIAGKGTSTEIRDINRLSNIYNMPKKSWQKVSGITHIYYNNKKIKVEVHWYEANGKRYEVKLIKEFENES